MTAHPAATGKLNILQVCDHLGWEGSRMHGVKRLFAWMIPRFDRDRYNVSLVSLRKKDLSEETLESMGIDITYLARSKFDPMTLPALLRIIREKRIDILHMHGYGATTFGRIAAGMRGIPTILHEHANLTDTPWFQKVADAVLERETDIALAVSESTAEFVIKARQLPPDKVKVVYLGVPMEEFNRRRSAEEVASARAELFWPQQIVVNLREFLFTPDERSDHDRQIGTRQFCGCIPGLSCLRFSNLSLQLAARKA